MKTESTKEEVKKMMGRTTNALRMGSVGLPNVGKSTLFNMLTKLSVPAENYPFCTIEPNKANAAVPDINSYVNSISPKVKWLLFYRYLI